MSGYTYPAAFNSKLYLVDIGGGRFRLTRPLHFYSAELQTVVIAPRGGITDLASIPPYVPGWLVPKLGDWNYPAVIHDAAYDKTLYLSNGRLWLGTKDQADRLFLEGMAARGVNVIRRRAMYQAVRLFGRGKAWDA